jgi:hypothetical protein
MAYPTVSAPYGLKPINLIGGQAYAGSTRNMPIASGYPTALVVGDVVALTTDGTLIKDTGTITATPVGVFLGVSYTDPTLKYKLFSNVWPAGTVASDAEAVVADDPDTLFKVVLVSGTTVVAGYARSALVGKNVALVQNAGNTTVGVSGVAVLGSSAATTNTLPLRVVDVVAETVNASGNATECIVKWNFGMHQYNRALGI